jgi:glc operon protein GlcG
MKSRKILTLDEAKIIAAAAEEEATKNGWVVAICVCDVGGHPILLYRMKGATPMSAMVAPEKARTSVLSRRPSKVFEDMINQGRMAALAMPVVTLEGGEMVIIEGECIGAVGVSGVQAGQDAQISRAGVRAIGASVDFEEETSSTNE